MAKDTKKDYSQRNLFIGIGIVALIILLIFIFPKLTKSSQPDDIFQATLQGKEDATHYIYNGFAMVKDGPLWFTQIQKGNDLYTLPMAYDPLSVENIPVELTVFSKIMGSERVFFSIDPDANTRLVVASIEVGRIIGNRYNMLNKETHGALSRPIEGDNETLVAGCDVATQKQIVLNFVIGNKTRVISSEDNMYCIFVEGTDEYEVVKAADKLAYNLVGIIKPDE